MIYRQIVMNMCIIRNVLRSCKIRKTPIGLTDRSFLVCSFIRFFYIILSSRQESPVEPVVYP